MENRINKKLEQIAQCICQKAQTQSVGKTGGLFDGEWGNFLFLHCYSSYSNDPELHHVTMMYSKKLLESFGLDMCLHTFCNGFSGILYLFDFLRENKEVDIDLHEIEQTLENYLVYSMKTDFRYLQYDFLHGSLGVGLYFLNKKTDLQPVRELIKFLYETATKDLKNNVFKWESVLDDVKNQRGYNISLSHGISSIIRFLTYSLENKVETDKSLEMLEGAIHYVLSQEMNPQFCGSHFPNYSLETKQNQNTKSRLAWCYGDLGVAISLWHAGKITGNPDWKSKAIEILLYSTQRLSPEENYVIEAGICHGSAGIALIFRRMYLETGILDFLKATQHWLNQTLNFSFFDDGLAGYKSFIVDKWTSDYTLLTGISGIGLVLLSYLKEDMQEWDKLLLIS